MKKYIAIVLCVVLVLSIVNVSFASTVKDEIIYMNLESSGKLQETYVVNVFHSKGDIVDYGRYDSIKNLTDMSDIQRDGEKIMVHTDSDKFYYQGNLKGIVMPWDIKIDYYLDGKKVEAEDLVAATGTVKIIISVKKSNNGNESIYNHFSLQVSVGGDSHKISEVVSKGANVAYAGGKTTVNYVILPKEEKKIEIEFQASDLEMDPIRFVAVPFKMDFDFDIEDMDNPMKKIDELKNGVSELEGASAGIRDGVSSLSGGLSELSNGSGSFNSGLQELSDTSEQLRQSSKDILEGINQLNAGLNAQEVDKNSLAALVQASNEIKNAITQMADGLREYQNAFSQFDNTTDFSSLISANEEVRLALEQSLQQLSLIPEADLTPEQVAAKALLSSQIDLIDRTIHALKYKEIAEENGMMSDNIQGVIANLEQQLQTPGLPEASIAEIQAKIEMLKKQVALFDNNKAALLAGITFIDTMESELDPLIAGLDELSENYNKFDAGVSSIGGLDELKTNVSQLANGYAQFDKGINQLIDGQNELAKNYVDLDSAIYGSMKGAEMLSDGADKMYGGISELNSGLNQFNIKEINNKVDDLKNKYTFGEYEVKSFVSSKNTNVKIQQFILATPAIEKEIVKKSKENKIEDRSLWTKLKRVFGY